MTTSSGPRDTRESPQTGKHISPIIVLCALLTLLFRYKRNDLDQYTIPYFQTDILYFAAKYPEILVPGCNNGKINSYNQLSISQLSGGAYTAESAAANPLCFANAFAAAEGASYLGVNLSTLTSAVAAAMKALGVTCPAITAANLTALNACPGSSLYGGPTAPIAPGAIQS